MTIREIKALWGSKDRIQGCTGKKQFATYDFQEFGKCVVVVVNDGAYLGRTVVALVQVATGNDLFHGEHSRPCDNMDDAIDVAGEIIGQMVADGEISEAEMICKEGK